MLAKPAFRWCVPLVIVAATCGAFTPVSQNHFVEWDDYENLLSNNNFRGLGWSQLGWMFTTFHMGPYQPLSWLTLGLDYSIWGMNPVGYHATNVLLHAANAVSLYFVSLRLYALVLPASNGKHSSRLIFGAVLASLCFSLHPLRVESVAWATERRDVLSGLFYLWAIYCYLGAHFEKHASVRNNILAALTWYVLSLLSKATAITFPAVLLLLDIYPLKRLTWDPRQWFAPQHRGVWREKIPFVVVACLFASLALIGQLQVSAVKSIANYGIDLRLAQAFLGAGFYLWKTVVPIGLSPLYEIPQSFGLMDLGALIGASAAIAISTALFFIRERWPAGLSCWLYYLVVLAPVLGLIPTGPQLVADRYSYLSCMSWAILAGGLFSFALQRSPQANLGAPIRGTLYVIAVVVCAILAGLTWRQSTFWRNTETLWSRALDVDRNSSIAHYNLARFIARQGRYNEAILHYREAIEIRPDDPDTHNNLGLLLAARGDVDKAAEHFELALRADPTYAKAYFNLGRLFFRQGRLDEAVKYFDRALQLQPQVAEIHESLGRALALQGKKNEAAGHFAEAVRILKSPQPAP